MRESNFILLDSDCLPVTLFEAANPSSLLYCPFRAVVGLAQREVPLLADTLLAAANFGLR